MDKILKFAALMLAAIGSVGAAAEPAVSSNTFGIIRVESSTMNTLIAVPWTWYSEREEDALNVLAKKLVKTEGLENGDLLYSYLADGTYRAWMVTGKDTKGGDGEPTWEPCVTVERAEPQTAADGSGTGTSESGGSSDSTEGTTVISGGGTGTVVSGNANPAVVADSTGTGSIVVNGDEDETDSKLTWDPYLEALKDDNAVTKVARGNAVWLRRQHPTDSEGKAKPFWVYGQSVSTSVSNDIAAPSGDETVHTTLLGNPYAQAVKINDLKFSATPDPMDRIFVPDGTLTPKTLMYVTNKKTGVAQWRYSYTTTNSAGLPITSYSYDIEVKPGLAFWYDRRGTGAMTITWTPPTADASSADE